MAAYEGGFGVYSDMWQISILDTQTASDRLSWQAELEMKVKLYIACYGKWCQYCHN